MFIFDAHLDLGMNAVEWNRDYTLSLETVRHQEAHLKDKPDRGRGVISLPELRRGNIGLVVATQLARVEHNAWSPIAGWRSSAQAWAMTQAQLAWYRAMETLGEMKQIRTQTEMVSHLKLWQDDGADKSKLPIGYILSLEGADSLVTVDYLEKSYAEGLRAIGPAHYGPGVYANGTDASGGFNAKGRDLLKKIAELDLILDATHLCDDCFWEMLDAFSGPIWSSHHNCRALVDHNRQISDDMIRALVARDAVIGVALDAWMMVPGWVRGKTTPESSGVTLNTLVDHIDHICQIAGSAKHVGLGTDLDGCFGREQTALDLETIADLQKLPGLLSARGYSAADITGIMNGNFLGFLRRNLPE